MNGHFCCMLLLNYPFCCVDCSRDSRCFSVGAITPKFPFSIRDLDHSFAVAYGWREEHEPAG